MHNSTGFETMTTQRRAAGVELNAIAKRSGMGHLGMNRQAALARQLEEEKSMGRWVRAIIKIPIKQLAPTLAPVQKMFNPSFLCLTV
jgi:hypothetical protein